MSINLVYDECSLSLDLILIPAAFSTLKGTKSNKNIGDDILLFPRRG